MMRRLGAKSWALVAIVLSFVFSALVPEGRAWMYETGIVIDIGIAIVMAVSLNLINGHTGQFSLGHAGFMAVGAFTAAKVSLVMSPEGAMPAMFPLALVTGGLVAAAAGLLVGVPSLRLRGDYLAIVTLGFGEIIRVIFQNMDAVGAASGLSGIPRYTTIGWTFALAAVTVFVVTSLVNSTYGRGFIAVHDDEVAAESMGINTTRYKVTAFVVGAFFAGIAGGLYAHHKTYLSPVGFDWIRSIDFVVMVILGGMGRTAGVILAAVILTVLPEGMRMIPPFELSLPWMDAPLTVRAGDLRMILFALIIILLMLLRPQGLFAFERKKKEVAK